METRPIRLFLTVLPQNVLVPSQQSLAFFSAGESASVFTGIAAVVSGTGSLTARRWNGRGGGQRWGPGIAGVQSSSGAFPFDMVVAPVFPGETDPCGVVLESSIRAGSENVLDDADFEVAGVLWRTILAVRSSRLLVPRMIFAVRRSSCAENRCSSLGATTGVVVQTVQNSVPQLQFIDVLLASLLWRRGRKIPTKEIPLLQYTNKVVDILVVLVWCRFHRCNSWVWLTCPLLRT